jgi:hypothetical protein
MRMLGLLLVAAERSGRRLVMAGGSGAASAGDLEMDSTGDSALTEGSDSTEVSGSVAGLDSDAGDVALDGDGDGALASVGDGIRGGDGATRIIRIRTGEDMAAMADTTITRRTVRT